MSETESDGAELVSAEAAEKGLPDSTRSDGVEPGKELGGGGGLSQLDERDRVGEFRVPDTDVEALGGGEEKRETLAKDQVEGVRQNSDVESNGEEDRALKETEGGKEVVLSGTVPVDQVAVENHESGKEAVINAIVPVDEVAVENHGVEPSPCPTPWSDPPTASATKEQRSLSRVVEGMSVSPAVRTPTRDGYNWRKYGQKQVKSPKGSRSYYRCTYSDCCAKKIECSNDSGNVIEIVNKGSHSHDPPRKNNYSVRESRVVSSIQPVSVDHATAAAEGESVKLLCYTDPSISAKENIGEPNTTPERKRLSSSVSDGNGEIEAKKNHLEEPDAKRRLKKDNNTSCLDFVSKSEKKHKFVVHAAGDVGVSGDGYRWRKYGQKMVKGNPNPRNYYRCTSAGCPVRKHIETAVDNTTAVIITYKGVHNHDMPVPKKRHGLPSATLVAAAAPTSMNSSLAQAGEPANPPRVASPSQCSGGRESEMSNEANEKAMESARTLLSIGFEIKQC
ncbi:PREDICTED: probable WRKY transcription factor 32 [Tarenaya hassleriana]|uniref:probable WRKY transcription factor 32 n=1 Tax=Tarenaya hassleriana TaxID=28532 RepID=UPI00053C5260|nr:PREDICTED: probable WRKY transcription factor 32 [Tarenaya hassleriana]